MRSRLPGTSLDERFTLRRAVTMVEAWVAFPLVLVVLSLGLGLLVERLAGADLPWPLLLPVGSAAIVAISSLGVLTWPRASTPLIAGLAAFGLVLGVDRRVDVWALCSGAVVFACFGMPVLVSGTPTFAGYIKLDDTATFLALVDRAIDHGRSLAGLAPSSYEAALAVNLAHGYPLGSVLPLGVGHELVRVDVAWLYQPWLSWNAAMLALCLYQLAAPLIGRRSLRAAVAIVAGQPALLYGFALWGGVKELVAAALLATAVALAAELKAPYRVGSLAPLAIACAALLDAVSVAGAVWLLALPPALALRLRRASWAAIAGLATAAVLALPAFVAVSEFYRGSNRTTFTDTSELGNLIRPLRFVQVLGIWPSGDFRLDPHARIATGVLLLLATAAALAGVGLALTQKAHGLVVAVGSALVGAIVFVVFGAPWFGGKALAIGSPFVLVAAAVGSVGLITNRRLVARRATALAAAGGAAAAVAVLGGVAWSNALAYHDVNLAPFAQLTELQRIGTRFAGDGPALMTEYQPYGVRHFLRRLDAEGVSELRRRPIVLRGDRTAAKGEYVDLDRLRLRDLLVYRTVVLRKSPTESRPPAPYRLVSDGRWYRVWQRVAGPAIAEHRPLGDALEPGGPAPCPLVNRLAAAGRVAAPASPVNLTWSLDLARLPRGWAGQSGGAVVPSRSGTVSLEIGVPRRARYRVWIGGSIRGRLTVDVNGSRIGSVERQLQSAGQWLDLGARTIPAGTQRVAVRVSVPTLSPGSGGGGFPLGPLLLQPNGSNRLFERPAPRALCGRNLDWIEVLAQSRG
jgi:hypothetical protein